MSQQAPSWPAKCDLFGVGISATDYDQVADRIIDASRQRCPAVVDLMPVHGLITAVRDASYRQRVNRFQIVAPDGQPVRWALNSFHRAGLPDRVYGPELMLRVSQAAALAGVSVYLYGSHRHVLDGLCKTLLERVPSLVIAGTDSPPFRPLSDEEDRRVVEQINASGAGIVFLGLGCPRQEIFADEHRHRINAVQICVGAAFDFLAGTKSMAPPWMQQRGLEWLFRLAHEPGRLWRRYLVTNSIFSLLVMRKLALGY